MNKLNNEDRSTFNRFSLDYFIGWLIWHGIGSFIIIGMIIGAELGCACQ